MIETWLARTLALVCLAVIVVTFVAWWRLRR